MCTFADSCDASGVCVGQGVDCNDGEGCTEDSCEDAVGCIFDPEPWDGVPCSDGDVCTETDTCTSGVCVGVQSC